MVNDDADSVVPLAVRAHSLAGSSMLTHRTRRPVAHRSISLSREHPVGTLNTRCPLAPLRQNSRPSRGGISPPLLVQQPQGYRLQGRPDIGDKVIPCLPRCPLATQLG